VINIGGEGQIIMGAILGTSVALAVPDLPRWILGPLVIVAGAVGGGIWGAIPGALKAYAGVNEILSTIMLNIVAIQLMNYLLRGPMIDPIEKEGSRIPQTERLTDNAALPTLIEGTRLHLGVVIAVVAAIIVYFILFRTPLGFRLRAVGHNPDAARASGISVEKNIVAALSLSGALSGLAGVMLVFGSESLRFVTDGSSAGFTGSAGFNGIVAALFGGLHPLWTIPSSFLFGALLTGATELQRELQIPNALAVALNGLIVLFVVSSAKVRAWLHRFIEKASV
jgi:simple sugar transport system permease protein